MIIRLYSPESGRDLAAGLIAEAPKQSMPVFAERTVVATGGAWQPRDWHIDLARSAAVTALGVRTRPGQSALASRAWADIARLLVRRSPWQHGESWAAVRTSAQSMLLLADSHRRPDPASLHAASDMIRRVHERAAPGTAGRDANVVLADPAPSAPLHILDARHDRAGRLAVLVDRIPDLAELRFTPYMIPPDPQDPRTRFPYTLFVAQHPGGYVEFLLDTGDGQGCRGEPFDLHLTNGSSRVVVGPWSSSPDAVAQYVTGIDLHPRSVSLHERAADFHAGAGGHVGHLTRGSAQRALHLAADYRSGHPAALAHAFDPPGLPAGPGGSASSTGRSARPDAGHGPATQIPRPRR